MERTLGPALLVHHECTQCHSLSGEGGTIGPALDGVGARLRPDYMEAWIRNPPRFKPTTEMPAFAGGEEELRAVIDYLLTLED